MVDERFSSSAFASAGLDSAEARALADLLAEEVEKEMRSEEHTSELQSRSDLVCRLLLEKKKKKQIAGVSAKPIANKKHILTSDTGTIYLSDNDVPNKNLMWLREHDHTQPEYAMTQGTVH